jgi:hypothetical protein
MTTMRRAAAGLLALTAVSTSIASACSNAGRTAAPSSLPVANPPSAPASVTTPTVPPSTTKALPECQASDAWGVVILGATSELAPERKAEVVQGLDARANQFKLLVPAQAPSIDARTAYAKAVVQGTATDAQRTESEQATTALNAWFDATCK